MPICYWTPISSLFIRSAFHTFVAPLGLHVGEDERVRGLLTGGWAGGRWRPLQTFRVARVFPGATTMIETRIAFHPSIRSRKGVVLTLK